jgi:hypothetical protein
MKEKRKGRKVSKSASSKENTNGWATKGAKRFSAVFIPPSFSLFLSFSLVRFPLFRLVIINGSDLASVVEKRSQSSLL